MSLLAFGSCRLGGLPAVPRVALWERSIRLCFTASSALLVGCRDATSPADRGRPGEHAPSRSISAVAPRRLPAAFFADSAFVAGPSGRPGRFRKNTVALAFHPGTDSASRARVIGTIGGTVVGGYRDDDGTDGFYFVRIPSDDNDTLEPVFAAVDTLGTMPEVELPLPVEITPSEDAYRRPVDGPGFKQWHTSPADAQGATWALEAMAAPLAWGCVTGDSTVRIAVVDMGVHSTPNIRRNLAYVDSSPGPLGAHGYHVAGVLAAVGNDSAGSTGMMWRAALDLQDLSTDPANPGSYSPPVYTPDGLGVLHSSHLIAVGRRGAQVINWSRAINWSQQGYMPGGPATAKDDERLVRDRARTLLRAIRRLQRAGRRPLFVLSAGNNGLDARWSGYATVRDSFPDQVLVVGGSDQSGRLWQHSNRGRLVEVLAPSVDVVTTDTNGRQVPLAGTSFAAPLVSGTAGLLLSFDPGRSWTAGQIKQLIIEGAQAGGRSADGVPIANAYESLRAAAQRRGAPLCGNRLWAAGGRVTVERVPGTPSSDEVIATFPADESSSINVLHGGRRVRNEAGWSGSWEELRWQPDGTWHAAEAEWSDDDPPDGGAFISTMGYDHDWEHSASLRHESSTSVRLEVDRATAARHDFPNSSTAQCYEMVGSNCNRTASEYQNIVGAVAMAPRGDFVYYALGTQGRQHIDFGAWSDCSLSDTASIRTTCRPYTEAVRTFGTSTIYERRISDGTTRVVAEVPGVVFWLGVSESGGELAEAHGEGEARHRVEPELKKECYNADCTWGATYWTWRTTRLSYTESCAIVYRSLRSGEAGALAFGSAVRTISGPQRPTCDEGGATFSPSRSPGAEASGLSVRAEVSAPGNQPRNSKRPGARRAPNGQARTRVKP